MKIDWQWPGAIVFGVVFLVVGTLVFTGKLAPDTLGILIAWLVPSPVQNRGTGPAGIILVLIGMTGIQACGGTVTKLDDAELQQLAGKLAGCRAEGRDAGPDGGFDTYEACKRREGIR